MKGPRAARGSNTEYGGVHNCHNINVMAQADGFLGRHGGPASGLPLTGRAPEIRGRPGSYFGYPISHVPPQCSSSPDSGKVAIRPCMHDDMYDVPGAGLGRRRIA